MNRQLVMMSMEKILEIGLDSLHINFMIMFLEIAKITYIVTHMVIMRASIAYAFDAVTSNAFYTP